MLTRFTLTAALTVFATITQAQFADPVDLTTPREAVWNVQSADINDDGIADLVVVQDDVFAGANLVWYPGTGGGQFGATKTISNTFVNNPEVADVDGDGDLDVTFAITTANQMGWIANDGSGNFGPINFVADTLTGVRKVTPYDLDEDGDMDLMSMSDDPVFFDLVSSVVWYENDGSGNFPTGHTIFKGSIRDPFDIAAGDLDGDGDPDIAVACLNTDDVTLFENLGGATSFGGKNVLTTDLIGCTDLELGDLENDGDLDIVVANIGVQRVAWLKNNGSGVFSLVSLSTFGLSTVDDATGVHIFDANGDGFADVAASLVDENAIDLFLYAGSGSFHPAQRITDRTFYATDVVAADLDDDGDLDLISSSQNDSKLAWYENLGGTGIYGPNRFINYAAGGIAALAAADLDGDGDDDVVSVSGLDQKLAIYENLGSLEFGIQTILDQSAIQPRNVIATDLDADGDFDLAVIGQEVLKVYLNNGSGSFTDNIVFSGFNDTRGLVAADLDADGKSDLVVSSWFDSKLSWFRNLGGGAFGVRQIIASPGGADGLVADDWDGDGDWDLAVSSEFNDQILYYQNLGSAVFAPSVVLASSLNGLFDLESRDMNGDGRRDILFAAFYANAVGYVPSLAGGIFGSQVVVTTTLYGPWGIDSWDPDGDGDQEMLVSVYSENRTVSIDNLGGGTFGTRRTALNAYEYHKVTLAADLDGDGDEDLLIGFKNTLTLVENLRLSGVTCNTSSAPSGLSSVVSPAGVNLSWSAIPGSAACQVQGRPLGAPAFAVLPPIVGFQPTTAFVAASKLTPGTTYEWKVRCACSLTPPSLTPFSPLSTFTVPFLKPLNETVSPQIFPNPASGSFQIAYFSEFGENILVRLVDAQGRLQFSGEMPVSPGQNVLKLNTDSWLSGLYNVSLIAKTTRWSGEVVVAGN